MDEIKDQSSSKLKTPEDLTSRPSSNFYSSEVMSKFKRLGLKETDKHNYVSREIEDAASHLDNIIKEWREDSSLETLEGARILDIGSGTAETDDSGHLWWPYFAEIAAVNGAEVTALDIRQQTEFHQRLFTGIQMDIAELVINGELAEHTALQGKEFDIIAAKNFVGSNPAPEIDRLVRDELGVSLDNFQAALVEQLKPLVAEGGIIDLDGKTFYRRVSGEFREETAVGTKY